MLDLHFTLTDILFACIILIFAIRGGLKGFIFELFSIVVVLISIFVASRFSYLLEPKLAEFINQEDLIPTACFILLFFMCFIVLNFMAMNTLKILKYDQVLSISSLLGFLFGTFKGILVCGFLVYVIQKTDILNLSSLIRNGVLGPYIIKILPLFDNGSYYLNRTQELLNIEY